jgi:hypothetical protein
MPSVLLTQDITRDGLTYSAGTVIIFDWPIAMDVVAAQQATPDETTIDVAISKGARVINHGEALRMVQRATVDTTSDLTISITPASILENSAAGQVIGTLAVRGPGAWTYTLLNTSGGRVALDGTVNSIVKTTSTPFNYEAGATATFRVRAVRDTPFRAVEQDVVLNILDDPSDNPLPAVADMDLITQTFTGGLTIADIGASLASLTAEGLPVQGQSKEFIGPFNTRPNNYIDSGAGSHHISSVYPAEGVFTPVDFWQDGAGGILTSTTTRALAIGEKVMVRFRFAASPNFPSETAIGVHLSMFTSVGGGFEFIPTTSDLTNNAILTLGAPSGVGSNGATRASVTKIGTTGTRNADGSITFDFLVTAVTAEPLILAIRSASNGHLKVYGIQCQVGTTLDDFATANITGSTGLVVAGTDLPVSGQLKTLLTGTAGAVAIEFKELQSPTYPSKVLSNGATTGAENEILAALTSTTARAAGATTAVVGFGGMRGIVRMALAWDAAGYKICVNGGKVISVANPLASGAIWKLLNGTTCNLRRISAWNTKLDDFNMVEAASIFNRNLANPGQALAPGISFLTFNDDFDAPISDIVRTRTAADYSTFPAVSNPNTVNQYSNGIGFWMPRYATETGPKGGTLQGNGEYEFYTDPQYPWDASYVSPFSKSPAGDLRITARWVGNLAAALQAQIPNRFTSGGVDSGAKFKYTSGCLNTAGRFEQQYGYFEVRAKVPTTGTAFPAPLWLLAGDHAVPFYDARWEIDLMEIFGSGTKSTAAATLHWNNYGGGQNLARFESGIDLGADFHTYGVLWLPTVIISYFDGKEIGRVTLPQGNLGSTKGYMLMDYAIGADFITGSPTQDSSLDNSFMDIDYVRVLQVS